MTWRGIEGEVVEIKRGDGEISSFEWRIPDFLSLTGEGGDRYASPSFHACDGSWFLRICPKGLWRDPSSDWVSLLLCRLDTGPPQTLDVTLGIRGPEGVERKRGRIQEFSYDDDTCFWRAFCLRAELSEQNSRLMPGNVLVFSLDMKSVVPRVASDSSTQTVEESKEAEASAEGRLTSEKEETDVLLRSEQNMLKSGEDSEVTLKEQGMEELKESLKRLLVSGKDSDVVVKVQGKEFPAHRLVLQVRSAVFEAMFSHNMVEKMRGVVSMEDCDQETFPDFLEHVYTGSVEMISTGNVFSLFAASDKYDLKTLKKACAEFMKKNLTITSFCNAITLAIKYDEKELTELATEFFCSHSLEICKTVEWQVFLTENPIVGNELIIKGFSKYQHI